MSALDRVLWISGLVWWGVLVVALAGWAVASTVVRARWERDLTDMERRLTAGTRRSDDDRR